MPKLYTFGCSFTEDFEGVMKRYFPRGDGFIPDQVKYVKRFLNGEIPKAWPQILGDLLGYETINYAMGGACNDDIFERVCNHSDEFTKDDIVIIGWTHYMRYRWPHPENWVNMFITYTPTLGPDKFYPDENAHQEIVISRESRCVLEELYNRQKLIVQLSKSVGFKVYFWAACTKIINSESTEFKNNNIYLLNNCLTKDNNIFNEVYKNGGQTIMTETNNLIPDGHLGRNGHQVQARLFYEYILSR